MINLAENNINLPKPSLGDHRVPEPPSEPVNVDVNTLLSQSNYLSLRTTYPTIKFYKNGWLKSNNILLPQLLKYVVINCGTNNLDMDNPDKISDGLICIALLFQKRMKHLQIIVNGLISRDAINTRRRQKLL